MQVFNILRLTVRKQTVDFLSFEVSQIQSFFRVISLCLRRYQVIRGLILQKRNKAYSNEISMIGISFLLKEIEVVLLSTFIIVTVDSQTHDLLEMAAFWFRGCPRGVMVKAMDCGIVVLEFVLQSRYYVHFRTNTLGKGMNPVILPAMG